MIIPRFQFDGVAHCTNTMWSSARLSATYPVRLRNANPGRSNHPEHMQPPDVRNQQQVRYVMVQPLFGRSSVRTVESRDNKARYPGTNAAHAGREMPVEGSPSTAPAAIEGDIRPCTLRTPGADAFGC